MGSCSATQQKSGLPYLLLGALQRVWATRGFERDILYKIALMDTSLGGKEGNVGLDLQT
jgi:hypothetical protein